MSHLTDQQVADALLTIVAAIPTAVPLNVLAIHGLGMVLAWGWREDAQLAILEAPGEQAVAKRASISATVSVRGFQCRFDGA